MNMVENQNKVTLERLAIIIRFGLFCFSGVFKDSDGVLKAFDFANLTGNFGGIL